MKIEENKADSNNLDTEKPVGLFKDENVISDFKKENELLLMAKQSCGRAMPWKEALKHLVSIDINIEKPELYIIDLTKTDLNKFS